MVDKNKNFEKKKKVEVERVEHEQQHISAIVSASSAFHCAICHKPFTKKGNYDNHMEQNVHTYGVSLIHPTTHKVNKATGEVKHIKTTPNLPAVEDVVIDYVLQHTVQQTAEVASQIADTHNTNNTNNNNKTTVTLFTGVECVIPSPVPGFANKTTSPKTTRTVAQLEFIEQMFLAGEKNKDQKITADIAHNMMKLVGTQQGETLHKDKYPFMAASQSGYPRFSKTEILTKEQIKPYFSKGVAALRKQVAAMRKTGGLEVVEGDEGDCE
jgi:hypothetical protein